MIRKIILLMALIQATMVPGTFAQNDTVSSDGIQINGGLDIYTRYVWRGRDYGNSPSLQPWLSFEYKGFSFGAEGEYRVIGPGWQETDLYVAKSFKYLTLTLYDYYSFLDTMPGNLYEFSTGKTGHLFELMATLSDFSPLPISLTGSWLFAGSDPDRSLYFEIAWTQALRDGELGFVFGFTPHKGYYAPKAAIVNVGVTYLKELKVSDTWNLPVSLALILNPEEKNLYLVAGISL